jgi:D-alanine transaminase
MSNTKGHMVYLNGEYLDLQKAKISVLDRGFLFGDSVYEVIPVYNHRPFAAKQHLDRLTKSLTAIHMDSPLDHDSWIEIFDRVLASSALTDKMLYIQVTRGAYASRGHAIPDDVTPTVLVAALPTTRRYVLEGVNVITVKDQRWANCRIKATTLLPNVLAKDAAQRVSTHDAIFVKDGFALEGTASNLFMVKGNTVFTAPLSANILPGITRSIVIDILKTHHIAIEEKMITLDELKKADEIWLTGSVQEIVPVVLLDHCAVADGIVGPMWKRITRLYADRVEQETT